MLVKQNMRSLLVDDKGQEGATPAKNNDWGLLFSVAFIIYKYTWNY